MFSNRINICRKNEYETTRLCQKITDEVYRKYLEVPSDKFWHLTEAALEGLESIDPLSNMDTFLTFFYEMHDSKCKLLLDLDLFGQ